MPYFVRIGAIRTNRTGVGSRGYQVFRRGRNVIVHWGAVEVKPGRRFLWIFREEKTFGHPSESAAKLRLAHEVRRRKGKERYSQLPPGQKILLPR